MEKYIWLIPVLPFLSFVINIFFGKKTGEKAGWIASVCSAGSCAIALCLISKVIAHGTLAGSFPWLTVSGSTLRFGYLLDPAAATLLFVVTVIGTLIQIYSIGYMHSDPRYPRFFAYVSLFMAAMLTLVIADNYLLFFIAWEVMGLCSYLLIGFWFEKDSAANASLKAFLTTRVGDVGFFLGILTVHTITGTLNFQELGQMLGGHHAVAAVVGHSLLPLAALLVFCGTIGKSAQIPLFVWLPDAMEGPTSVSALIHAATMVAAGVYLIARSYMIFMHFQTVLFIVACIGSGTALFAALIALTQTDLKKVLAYSTISQLGFMVAAMGLGNPTAGIFHLMTHAFFKALLFLGAGSVIHGTGTQDMRKLGGLFGHMKSTAITFLIASIAIAGVPPLSGFWSKDEILLAAYSGSQMLYLVLSVTAFLTAFYMFRLVFMTFFGKSRDHHIHAHESPAVMTIPLWILAVGSALIGIPGSPFMHRWFQEFLALGHPEMEESATGFVMASSVIFGLAGIFLAYLFYLVSPAIPEKIAAVLGPLYRASKNKFYVDEIYSAVIIRPFQAIGGILFRFDAVIVDGIVNGTGSNTLRSSTLSQWFDKYFVDGLVNLVGAITQIASAFIRRIQTGLIQNYLLLAVISVLILFYFEGR